MVSCVLTANGRLGTAVVMNHAATGFGMLASSGRHGPKVAVALLSSPWLEIWRACQIVQLDATQGFRRRDLGRLTVATRFPSLGFKSKKSPLVTGRLTMIRPLVLTFALSLTSSVRAVPLAPLQQPDDMVVTVREACGAGYQRVGGRCVCNTADENSGEPFVRKSGGEEGIRAFRPVREILHSPSGCRAPLAVYFLGVATHAHQLSLYLAPDRRDRNEQVAPLSLRRLASRLTCPTL